MGLTERLAYVISVDASGAAGFTKAAVSAEQLAASTTKAAAAEAKAALETAKLSAAEAKAAGDKEKLAKADLAVEAASKKYSVAQAQANKAAGESKAAAASKELQSLEGAANKAGGPLNALSSIFPQLGAAGVGAAAGPAALAAGVVAAGTAAAKFALEAGHSFADATAEVSKFKNTSGATAEQASIFRVEAKALGVDVDSLATAIYKMSNNINTAPQKFRDAGVAIAHTKDGTVDLVATLGNASDAYRATNDQVQKNAIVSAVAGKAGQQIIPILKAGSQALAEYKNEAARRGEIFDDGQLQKGFELRVAYREVQNAQEALSTSIGSQLAPALTREQLGITAVIDKLNKMQQTLHGGNGGGFGFVDDYIAAASPLGGIIDVLGSKHEKAAKAAATLTESLDNERVATERATKEAEDHAAALDQEETAALGVVHADESVVSAQDGLTAAHKRVDDAQKQVVQHGLDLQRANRDTADATRSVQDAEDKLAEARRQAPRDLAKAREDEASSTHKIADATDELTVAVAKYGAESHQAADAADKLASAREDHADAADKLNQLQKNAAHPKSVADAEQSLADAKNRANDAQQRANDLAAQDPTAAVTEAKKGLTAAEYAYRDALIAQADQRKKLNDDIATGKVNAGELADSLGGVIDMLKAAGVDPAVLAGLDNLRIFVAGQPGGSPALPPIAVGPHVNPDTPTKPAAPFTDKAGGGTLNVTVNAQTNADPTEIAAAVAWAARARGLS